jgi:hypothetical protein
VAQARKWIDAMTPPYGLRDEVADLVVLAWAALRTRAWYLHGGAVPPPKPGTLRPEMELRPEPLPAPADWKKAASRAEALFASHVNPYLTAAGVAELAVDIQHNVDALTDHAISLVVQIKHAYQHLGLPEDEETGRLATARAGEHLLTALQQAGGDKVRLIETLSQAALPGTETALAKSLKSASDVKDALASFPWDRLAPLREAEENNDDRGRSAASTLRELRQTLRADEFASSIKRALVITDQAIFDWLAGPGPVRPSPGPDPRPGPGPVRPTAARGSGTRSAGAPDSDLITPLTEFLRAHRGQEVVAEWRVAE